MPVFSQVSWDRIATCDPRLQDILQEVIQIVDFTVIEGHRDQAAQDAAFNSGRSQKRWPFGNHNAIPSRAVDIAPYLPDVRIDWNDLIAFGRLMGIVQAIGHAKGVRLRFGLDWDMDFRSVNRDPDEGFLDAPHVELVEP